MDTKISRRSFVTATFCGIGAVALGSGLSPITTISEVNPQPGNGKKLLATTDYFDNIIGSKFLFERKHLDALHKYLASIGVTRHQWMFNPSWNCYDITPNGFDLLKEATESAHQNGLEFYAVIKPFEGGAFGNTYPHSLPLPEDSCAIRDIRGIYPIVRTFVAANPHLCLKRRPGTYEAKGQVSAIRLVKGDDKPTRVNPGHLTIWTSHQNNGFKKYEGPVSFRESVEWRPTYPKSRDCRILHLEGLQLPAGHKYILVSCPLSGTNGDFTNERGSIVELAGPENNNVPFILSNGKAGYKGYSELYENYLYGQITRYFQNPEVREEFTNREKAEKHFRDFYSFDEKYRINVPYTFDKEGFVAVACGKPEFMLGNLHPIYPEVRQHWLDMIGFCLGRGVDGINIRHSNHVQSPEDWEYGFNDAVIEAAGGRTDYPAIRRANGNAYTQFLREARELVKSRDKTLVIHLYSQMLKPDDRTGRMNYLPPNFEWQWETWVREIADELEFRGAWTLRPENLLQVLETFAAAASAAKKPFYFQGNMKELGFNGPFQYQFTRGELEMVKNNPEYNGFVLYETANFTRVKKDGAIEGSPVLENLLKEF